MKLIAAIKLLPTPEHHAALLVTLERANAAANTISRIAWETGTFRQFGLHKLAYHRLRVESGLSAQVIVRLEAKVSDAYKLDKKRLRTFRTHGSIAYDSRILRYLPDAVSIWTVEGRQRVPFVCGERQRALLACQQGESDLVYRDGQWFLHATCEYTEPPEGEPNGYLGVDMGVVNVATDSDGTVYS
ncbi:MAG TPA: transposase, partial [Chloroflexota bacterium]